MKYFRRSSLAFILSMLLLTQCSSPPKPKKIKIAEQIVLDNQKSKDLQDEFSKRVQPILQNAKSAQSENNLTNLAQALLKNERDFDDTQVTVKIHQDGKQLFKRFFPFPGTTIWLPESFLIQVQYENELAAALTWSIAQVIERTLSKKLEIEYQARREPILVGPGSVFNLEREEQVPVIATAVRLLVQSKYDPRGLPSFFQRYYMDYRGSLNSDSDFVKREVDFNVREANRIKSEYVPLRDPVVRSDAFIQFKKWIMGG